MREIKYDGNVYQVFINHIVTRNLVKFYFKEKNNDVLKDFEIQARVISDKEVVFSLIATEKGIDKVLENEGVLDKKDKKIDIMGILVDIFKIKNNYDEIFVR